MDYVNDRANELAQAMVAYYELKVHCDNAGSDVLRQDTFALRQAYDVMVTAQNDLAFACETFAKDNA